MLKGYSLKFRKYNNAILKKILFLSYIFFSLIPYGINANNAENLAEIDNYKQFPQNTLTRNTEYLLGVGDQLFILLNSLPEYTGYFYIDPDGTINLPGLDETIYVEGLTLVEVKNKLLKKYSEFVIDPDISVFISIYRPITVYIRGEVKVPGLYTLRGSQNSLTIPDAIMNNADIDLKDEILQKEIIGKQMKPLTRGYSNTGFPTVYDVLRSARGITPYSDLSSITVVRKNNESDGGGQIMTQLNFLKLFKEGDLSQNIRVFDQDVITVSKNKEVFFEQLVEANKSNLSPLTVKVLVTGNVQSKGVIELPRGSSLNLAIEAAGREKLLTGKIKFLRYSERGIIEKRSFSLNRFAKHNSYQNPILNEGDIIHVSRSIVGKSSDLIKEIASPLVNSYTIYKIFSDN